MKKTSLLLSLMIALFCSCSSKMGELPADYFTVTPQVMEVVGSEIPVTIDGKFPAKFFNKKSVLTITPVLKYEGGSATAESVVFQGEKVRGNNRTILYDKGGSFTMKMSFDYIPAMEKSSLYLNFTVKKGDKTYNLPEVKIADGCIATSQLYRSTAKTAKIAIGEDVFQRVIKQAKEANIMFLIQQTNLRAAELKSDDVNALKAAMRDIAADAENKVVDNIEVAAYASPDGGMSLNTDIATGRETSASKFVKGEMDKAKLEGYLDTDYTAEDWDGFKELVSKSELPDKELILRVLSMYNDPEEREQQIKNISSVYKDLADEILPQLRRARITLNYQLIGRSDDEIMEQFATDPKALSLEEILYAAVLTDDTAEKQKIYSTATMIYPGDYRAYNNLGVLAYNAGDYAAARERFAQAAKIDKNAPEVNVNLGYLELLEGNVAAAESYMAIGSSAKAGDEALGNLNIAKGLYGRAAYLLEKEPSNSTALAQLLDNDYSTAKKTIAAIKNPDATTHYIKAVLGARTGNAALIYDGLKSAVKLDPSMAKKALGDLEFAKYVNDEAFKSILK
ncbi:MAG: hypothetical protein J6B18_06315 [Bacteroidaceae bacterium]|nr:hypothetical protein [Bacteroidaceae bacterium]